jgi:hypothetical protein
VSVSVSVWVVCLYVPTVDARVSGRVGNRVGVYYSTDGASVRTMCICAIECACMWDRRLRTAVGCCLASGLMASGWWHKKVGCTQRGSIQWPTILSNSIGRRHGDAVRRTQRQKRRNRVCIPHRQTDRQTDENATHRNSHAYARMERDTYAHGRAMH